ncbi:MAG: DNA cytosine methyltransferase, partial [Thermoplasmata archaeon]
MDRPPSRVLSLFSGIGGLDLGVRRVLGDTEWVAYVECEAFACGVLAARVSDGSLAPAPLFAGDVRDFPAADFRGRVGLVTAGFPCPPVSHAGKRLGTADERWLWPEVARVLRETEAGWVLVENVSGLLSAQAGRAFGGVLADLDALGFDAEWTSVRAS